MPHKTPESEIAEIAKAYLESNEGIKEISRELSRQESLRDQLVKKRNAHETKLCKYVGSNIRRRVVKVSETKVLTIHYEQEDRVHVYVDEVSA